MPTSVEHQRPPRSPAIVGPRQKKDEQQDEKKAVAGPDLHSASPVSLGLSLVDWISIVVALISLTATFIFGAWAIKSYNAAETANDLSNQQLQAAQQQASDTSTFDALQSNSALLRLNNRLNLALLCSNLSSLDSDFNETCSAVLANSNIGSLVSAIGPAPAATSSSTVPALASGTYTSTAPSTPARVPGGTAEAPPSGSPHTNSSLGLGAIIGIIVGSFVAILIAIVALVLKRQERQRKKRKIAPMW